jgi:ubiquinone/menaquinone biosynthesis C-methylase UbiE
VELDRTRRDWTRLGARDPLWAVLVTPDGRHHGWDPEEFLATGRREVDAVIERIGALGMRPGHGRALDFGCGVGRLTQALRRHFDDVTGVDVSAPMLARARELDPGRTCTFVLNEAPDLTRWPDATFDLAYSSLAFQHIPTATAQRYLRELVRVVRPGGTLAVQVATRPDASLKGRLAAVLPRWAVRGAQRWVLRYPAPLDMYPLSDRQVRMSMAGLGRIAEARVEPMYGGHWVLTRYLVERV